MSNYSLHAIPVFWVLTLLPHAYAVNIIKKANNGKWDNVNARGANAATTYQKTAPAEVYARFERAEAAHKNGFENAPLFIGAMLAGNLAGLSTETMNFAAGGFLLSRVVYTLLYINVTRQKYSYLRSLVWWIGSVLWIRIYWKAGNALVS
ncbi:hypothetical protein P280DRAFT_421509 [Massarina eburnea CBS 473.64]|uniref:Membrane-associated proteins in eicosanoid and glutathione metabolism n=1 Tax=Massarina eburnea CBS 473.64 TaxID=1395130 RepID=A0A6A6S5L4_9PLEO|nr:hypothetical protein P280DRAFT_421509 [Massarina eburnea CBS 473.64]